MQHFISKGIGPVTCSEILLEIFNVYKLPNSARIMIRTSERFSSLANIEIFIF